MKLLSPDSAFAREVAQWFVCIVDVMCIQIVVLAVSDIFSIKCLTWILELFYAPLIILLGMVFEDQMFLGNIPLGLALLFLSMMIVSAVIGTVFYAGNKLYDKYMQRKAGRGAEPPLK